MLPSQDVLLPDELYEDLPFLSTLRKQVAPNQYSVYKRRKGTKKTIYLKHANHNTADIIAFGFSMFIAYFANTKTIT